MTLREFLITGVLVFIGLLLAVFVLATVVPLVSKLIEWWWDKLDEWFSA